MLKSVQNLLIVNGVAVIELSIKILNTIMIHDLIQKLIFYIEAEYEKKKIKNIIFGIEHLSGISERN